MFTALTYLATSLTLAILVSLARRQHHEEIDGSEQYRYPSLLVKVIGFATPMYAAMAAFIYFRDSPEERSAGFIFSLALVFGTFIIGNTVAYFYFRSFVIDLNPSCMTVSRLGRLKNIPWEQVATIIVVIGFRGGREMTLLNEAGKSIFKIGGSIEDFDDLVWSVKDKTRRPGVVIRERDAYGKWSQSVNYSAPQSSQ